MERLAMTRLVQWKDKLRRKPLIIHGARQVGKTWLMKEFGRLYFKKTVYISFDHNEHMKNVFSLDFDIDRILSSLRIEAGEAFQAEDTLLIFDEIQEAPRALACLKYFCENAPQYCIVAAGSLLGMALHEGTSFPVGKVEFLNLYPMNFREFLMAAGRDELCRALENGDYALIGAYSAVCVDWLKKYYYVGGMPEAVQCFFDTDDTAEVREVQKQLLLYYENDFSKHAPKAVLPRIRMVWNSIPVQLAKENRKFIYGIVREGSRAKDFEIAIQWLADYGLILRSYRVKKPGMPLAAYVEQGSFKMFMLDVGLLAAKGSLSPKVLLEGSRVFEEFKGALTEQYVAQELASRRMDLCYYSTDNSSGEIDFVVQLQQYCVPVEVKAEENLHAKSLRAFCSKYGPESAIRTSLSDYREQDWMVNVPLYGIGDHLARALRE